MEHNGFWKKQFIGPKALKFVHKCKRRKKVFIHVIYIYDSSFVAIDFLLASVSD